MSVIRGIGLPTWKVLMLEVPPPGRGLKTVTLKVFRALRSASGIKAVSWVEETKVVVLSESLNLTTEPDTKFVPLTVRVNWGELRAF